jgi:hypothetical protein
MSSCCSASSSRDVHEHAHYAQVTDTDVQNCDPNAYDAQYYTPMRRCGEADPEAESALAAEVRLVRERWLKAAMREIEIEEAEEEEADLPSIDALPAAEDLMEVVVANVSEWASLCRLRTVSKWLGAIATRHIMRVGLRAGPRVSDFDERGVIHLLGSAFQSTPWSFTKATQRVRVFNSEGTSSAPPHEPRAHPFFATRAHENMRVHFNNSVAFLLDRQPRRVFLRAGLGAWMGLDLGEHVRVRLESYTLRHSSQQGRALRSFRVDASNASPPQADADWTALHTVVNDARLGVAEHSSASWDLLEPAAQAVGEAYRYFRVVKTGPDAQGDDFLHISGIELYGHVRMCLDMRDPCA